jgi:hypothetical protein
MTLTRIASQISSGDAAFGAGALDGIQVDIEWHPMPVLELALDVVGGESRCWTRCGSPLRLSAAAHLARFTGSSRGHTESDLRCFLIWKPGLAEGHALLL